MPGISIHVVDVSRGIVAKNMKVRLFAAIKDEQFTLLVDGIINDAGILPNPKLSQTFAAGRYRAAFDVGEYYRSFGIVASSNPFLNVVNYDFGIDAPDQHIHLPFKCTPWGYSCFRGGA